MVFNLPRIPIARLLAAIWMTSGHVFAGDGAPAGALQPRHAGLAFDQPSILIQQRLFGLAHGVSLLAAACEGEPRYREGTMSAYREWNEQQAPAIEEASRDLARYYFGARAGEVTRPDIARALKLKDKLTLGAGSTELMEACATFAQALHNPRYDLVNQHRLQAMAIRFEAQTMTNAAVDTCAATWTTHDTQALDAALARWRERHAADSAEAKTVLEAEWTTLQWEGTFNQFVTQARQRGKMSATPERCKTMAQRLMTTNARPDDASAAKP